VPRKDFATLKVVDEGPDGVVIHGVKAVATLAPYANEYLGLTSPRPELASEEVVYFSVPMDSEGLRVHCRPSLAHPAGADHRLSACFDEMDAWVVFDHVFVPPERVFYRRRVDVNAKLFGRVLWWAYYHVLIRMAVKAEVLAGICVAMADYLGTAEAPHMQMALVEVISYVETLRAFIRAAEDEPIRAPSGLLIPNPTQVTLGRLHGVERHPQILQIVREVCGSGILMAPGEAEMRDPEAGADVYQYLVGPDARAPERFRLLKLAWEYAADSFGSRQLLFEMHNAGSVLTTKSRLVSAYDSGPLVRLAKELAGIGAEELARPE
jgi:4-hydroxyphenylacetate 3-monooxygenase